MDAERATDGIEPICRVLQIAVSSYYAHKQAEAGPSRRPIRPQRDAARAAKIGAAYRANYEVYGVRKVWHQLRHDGERVTRCTVARLMRAAGLQGAAARPGAAAVRGRASEPAVGRRLHLCRDVVRLRVRRVRDRRVLAPHRRLARTHDDADRLGARRARAGAARPGDRRGPRVPHGPRLAIRKRALHRAAGGRRRGPVGRQRGRRLRSRARRARDRPVQRPR